MTADIIQARYDQLDNIANRFGREAENTTALMQQVQRGVDALRQGGWEGQGGAAFLGEMDGVMFPAIMRLTQSLEQAESVTLQVKDVLQAAEEEAAKPFQITAVGFLDNPANNVTESISASQPKENDSSGFLGWLGDTANAVGDFIVDHRDEIALGGALIAAGIATVATGGLAAPIIAGAVAAGGITLGINAATPRYPLLDGVVSNIISGGLIGWGVGSAGAAIGALRSVSGATPWAAQVGGAAAQWTGKAGIALPIARIMTFAPPALELVGGGSMVISSGGLDFVIPEKYESTIHSISDYAGMGAAGLNLIGGLGGNYLIKRAFANPLSYTPGGSLSGAGNSKLFQGHHLYPQKELGRLDFPKSLLDDAVLMPSGSKNSFIPNLHHKPTDPRSIHGMIQQNLNNIGGRAIFDTMPPMQQLQFLQKVNRQYMSSVMTQIQPRVKDVLIWAGKIGLQ